MTQPGPAQQGPAPPPSSEGSGPWGWRPSPIPPQPPRRPGRRTLLIAAAVVVVLALAGGVVSTWGDGRPSQSAPAATTAAPASSRATRTTAAPQPATPAGVRAVEAAVERLRGLRFERPVPVTVESPAKVAAQLLRELDSGVNKNDLRRQGRALALLGELPQSIDLYQLLRDVQAESVLGFYVPGRPPAKGRLYVRSDHGLDPYTRIVLAHELTHAVTDQRYDLTLSDRLQSANAGDRAIAYSGLVEGDATFMMQLYAERELTASERADADRAGAAERTPKLSSAPPVVRESLLFPYAAGLSFVRTLYERGGWDAVNRAYRDPPASSEQLLHPERYLDQRDRPQTVRVPDLRGALGAGWRAGTRIEWGEIDSRLLLGGEFPVTTAERASDGWDGGELRTFESGNRTALVLSTVWDSPREASENCTAMSRWASARFGAQVAQDRWSAPVQQGALTCQGSRVAWLSAPDRSSLERLVSGFRRP